MGVTSHPTDLHDETLTAKERQEEIGRRIRILIEELGKAGATASEVSYMSAYVGTELGLSITDNSFTVNPVVLQGVVDATWEAKRDKETKEQRQEAAQRPDENAVEGEIVH